MTIQHASTGKPPFGMPWATQHEISRTNVKEIVQAGRTRWKVRMRTTTSSKPKAITSNTNFGHGNQHLAAFLLTLIRWPSLPHLLDLVDAKYKLLRTELRVVKPTSMTCAP